MKLNKSLLITAMAVIATATVGLSASAFAASNSSHGQPSLVQAIADKFHLNKSEVQQVFDQNRADHEQDRQQKLKERLDQAVKDGKLTQDQETKLLTEMQTLHDQQKSSTQTDKRADMKAVHDQLEQWAKDNGIDLSQVMPAHEDHHPMI